MKAAALSHKPWILSLVAGILLTFISLLYVGFPNGSGDANIPDRPQIRFPQIDLQSTQDDEPGVIRCAGMSIVEDRGFPAAITSSGAGCGDNGYYDILGLIFNITFYTLLIRGVVLVWHKFTRVDR
jgi:hypothetical protein